MKILTSSPLHHRFLFLIFFASTLGMASAVQAQSPIIRINAGSGQEASSDGVTFIGDTFFSDSVVGPVLSRSIGGTDNDALYQSERLSNDNGDPFSYNIPVPQSGTYSVLLHFAETAFDGPDLRVFDIEMEGLTVFNNYDIYAEAMDNNTAWVESVSNLLVNDGFLTIEFSPETERAKISGIEVFGPVEAAPFPFYLNVGGFEYISQTDTWSEDEDDYFLEGTTLTISGQIDGTADDEIYLSERFGTLMRFMLPGMPDGEYDLELHFAENFHTSAGARIFDVSIEGEVVLDDFDIFDTAGGNTAHVETFDDVSVTDGILNITLEATEGSATINGIAITGGSSVSNEREAIQPDAFALTQAFPNPFNMLTQFTLSVDQPQHVAIHVYNVLGQHVETVHDGFLAHRAQHAFTFDGASLPSGIYLIQATGEHFQRTQQVTLLK